MARLMRCIESHWQGDVFIAKGTYLPVNDKAAVPPYFEPYAEDDESKTTTRKTSK